MKRPFDWQKLLVALVILVLAFGATYYLFSLNQPETTLYVPAKDIPAYYLITATDLMTTTLPAVVLPPQPLIQESDLAGRYASQSLKAEKPVTEVQLFPTVDEKYVAGSTAVSIPATSAMTYNGQLTPGAIVTIWTVTDSGEAESLLDEVLVLDVQKVVESGEAKEGDFPYTIVLAVPETKVAKLLTAVANQTLSLTLNP